MFIENWINATVFYHFKKSPEKLKEIVVELNDLEEKIGEIGFSERILLSPYLSDAASSPSARLSEIVSVLLIVGGAALGVSVYLYYKKKGARSPAGTNRPSAPPVPSVAVPAYLRWP